MLLIYGVTALPAVLETFLEAKGTVANPYRESRIYVIILLLTTSFSALPLHWQSPLFSRRGKMAWTLAVPVLAAIFFSLLYFFGRKLER